MRSSGPKPASFAELIFATQQFSQNFAELIFMDDAEKGHSMKQLEVNFAKNVGDFNEVCFFELKDHQILRSNFLRLFNIL